MIPAWQKGKVIEVQQASPNTRRYWIELPETASFDFIPGQFVTVDLPIHEQRNKRWRSYSIASAPNGTNIIELIIVYVNGGAGSSYFFEQVNVGYELTLRGPQGIFTLPKSLNEKQQFFICTGTGIAPFRSMIHHIEKNKIPHQDIHLIFGTRTIEDILYYEEMKTIAASMPRVFYHPILSRTSWEGPTGYVHQIYQNLCKDRPDAQFMLCGWRNMIDEAKHNLLEMGYAKESIQIEIYG